MNTSRFASITCAALLVLSPVHMAFAGDRSFDLLRVCAWCYRARSEGIWRDIEDVVAGEHLLERATLPIVTHGICDACLAETGAELDALATRPSAVSPH